MMPTVAERWATFTATRASSYQSVAFVAMAAVFAAGYWRHNEFAFALGLGFALMGVLLSWERVGHRRVIRAYEQRIAALEARCAAG